MSTRSQPRHLPPCQVCQAPATAGLGPNNRHTTCIRCAALATVTIEPKTEQHAPVPPSILQSPAWEIAKPLAHQGTSLWSHQALALNHLDSGRNLVIATATASGKSLPFQLWTLHRVGTQPGPTGIIFYPTKALANDQARRWQQCCQTLDLPPTTIGQIDGSVPMSQRDTILRDSRIVIMTPDVCHAWLTRNAASPTVQKFLSRLDLIIIDEAHTYETVFGSNSAYLFRRLVAMAHAAQAPRPPQFIAATATIMNPGDHLQKLTGQDFTVVDEQHNGSPRHRRTLHHLALNARQGREDQVAQLIISIIDNDPQGQVIAFHDSRQGVERIAQLVGRPDSVLSYRSGFEADQRRNIEDALRTGEIRGVVTTSALELGIDMPDLNYGVNLDLPASRKQLHQRLGRIGRARPGTFVILAPQDRFASFGERLETYYQHSVEPSQLYLDNEYITYQQATCLRRELGHTGTNTMVPPPNCGWPQGFEKSLRDAHGRPPAHLTALYEMAARQPPQLAHSLRSTGEETLEIYPNSERRADQERRMGTINVSTAMKEAYPGAIYHHQGHSYTVDAWGRSPRTRAPFIRVSPLPGTRARTKPLMRRMFTVIADHRHIIDQGHTAHDAGSVTRLRASIAESVEGFELEGSNIQYYIELMKTDPRKTRKQREFPTTAIHIQVLQEWCTGHNGATWLARHELAQALRRHLAYQKSIAPPDISAQVDNIFIATPRGYYLSDNSIAVYDNIYGGLALTSDLYANLSTYALRIRTATDTKTGQQPMNLAGDMPERFFQWADRNRHDPLAQPPLPGEDRIWRVIRPGSEVTVFSPERNQMVTGTVTKPTWQDGVHYLVDTDAGDVTAMDDQITFVNSNHDWQLWLPQRDALMEIETEFESDQP